MSRMGKDAGLFFSLEYFLALTISCFFCFVTLLEVVKVLDVVVAAKEHGKRLNFSPSFASLSEAM